MTEAERNRLAESHLDLARLFARQKRRQGKLIGLNIEELESIAFEALVTASREFDPTRSSDFETLARLRMLDELRKYRRKQRALKRGAAQERRGFGLMEEKQLVAWNGKSSESPTLRPEVRDLIQRIEQLAGHKEWEFLRDLFLEGRYGYEMAERYGICVTSIWLKRDGFAENFRRRWLIHRCESSRQDVISILNG